MKDKQMHIVLGGSGAIGNAVLKELTSRGLESKTVEENKDVEGYKTIKADLLDLKQVTKAIEGSTHVYLCVGLPYSSEVWARDWPVIMKNAIEACLIHKAKLIFFDNVYMYGPIPLTIPFNESHTQNPTTNKGKARKVTTDLLLQAMKENKIRGVIGRSADFYGPSAINSSFYISFLQKMLEGKNPKFLSKTNIDHTYAYTLDNAKALVDLALDESTFGQVWHLPVGQVITMDKVLEIFNKELKTNFKGSYISKYMQSILGLFIKPIKEVREMLYQFDYPYVMSSQKFMNKFPDFKVTSYEVGLREMIKSFNK